MTSDRRALPTGAPTGTPACTLCTQTGFGLIDVRGDDAMSFLHGQLSSDVQGLELGRAQYSSYNSPKGRMLANLIVLRWPVAPGEDRFLLLLQDDLLAAILRRLSMFVLRSKVAVRDAGGDWAIWGLAGPEALPAARAAFGVAPRSFEALRIGEAALILAVPDGRLLGVCPRSEDPLLQAALAGHATRADADAWRRLDIEAGIPWIVAATSDLFVPQTANWELLGGVNFQKGCYPGQEIVARAQYLGRLKERLFAFHAAGPAPAPGTRLRSAAFGDQACGIVVSAVPDLAGGSAVLAVAQRVAVEAGDIRVTDDAQSPLTSRPLPYVVPAADTPRGRETSDA
ncbi:MAG TPA: folate-binding protein [Casimicrobiaceae bacterium]|nr:folate-binding protein [Casimicrobiaceae bacterium]